MIHPLFLSALAGARRSRREISFSLLSLSYISFSFLFSFSFSFSFSLAFFGFEKNRSVFAGVFPAEKNPSVFGNPLPGGRLEQKIHTDRTRQNCKRSFGIANTMVPPGADAHQRLLLEEKLSREARLMWCCSGTFSPKCPDHRSCVPHTTSAPGCGLGHLLLKEKAWAL